MIISKWGKTSDLETKADLPLWMDRSHAISSAISFNPCCAPTIVESESTELCESNNTVLKVASAKNNHLVTTSWNSSFNPLNNLPEKILLFYRQKKVSLSFSTRKTRKERRSDRSNVIFFFFFFLTFPPSLSSRCSRNWTSGNRANRLTGRGWITGERERVNSVEIYRVRHWIILPAWWVWRKRSVTARHERHALLLRCEIVMSRIAKTSPSPSLLPPFTLVNARSILPFPFVSRFVQKSILHLS